MKYILLTTGLIVIIFVVYQCVKVYKLIQVSKKLIDQTTAFSIISPQSKERFLIVGDSLGVGVGTTDSQYSIAGRLSQDYPQAEIQNLSVSGLRIRGGLGIAQALKEDELFDIIFIQLGANDVVRLTSLNQATIDLQKLFSIAQAHAKKVIYFNSGSLGYAPIFPFPIDVFYTIRSKYVYSQFQSVALKSGVIYVDLLYDRTNDPFLKNPNLFYAPDAFHVTDTAYEFWYQKIQKVLDL
ncbi:MAG: SGNH/GDSL hydrolase family protein [bacterium]|nr:SGNH/GDSL hydrolase family protein [bacterium]